MANLSTKKKDEIIDMVEEKEKALQEKDALIGNMQNEIKELKQMFMSMLSSQQQPQQVSKPESFEVETVYIGCNMMGKNILVLDKSREIELFGHKGAIPFSLEEATKVVNDKNYRKLFESGLFYFENEKWYKYFRIGTNVILSDDTLIEILKEKPDAMINKINIMTENKKNSSVVHGVLFRIAYLLKNNKIQNLDMENFTRLSDYFGVNISTTMKQLEYLE